LRWYDKNMKIATYNVRNLYDPGTKVDDTALDAVSESFFNKRIAYFTEQLQKLDLDIICFQEIGGELGVKVIAEALNCDYFCARPNKRGIRMAVIYKKDLSSNVSCESISFGDLPIPSIQVSGDAEVLTPIAQRRDILEITLTVNGKIISINTFHLKSNLPQYLENDDIENDKSAYIDAKFRCLFYKTMELCAIRRHADKRLAEGKEVVLLGDYNETNIASILDILTGSQNREVIEYHDLLVGYEGDATTHLYRGKKLVFDTIIASLGIKNAAKDIVVENTTLKDYSALPQGAIEHEVESDHALVFVDISL
jgi:exonuclease III